MAIFIRHLKFLYAMNAENVDLTVPNNHGHLLKKFKFRPEANFYFE